MEVTVCDNGEISDPENCAFSSESPKYAASMSCHSEDLPPNFLDAAKSPKSQDQRASRSSEDDQASVEPEFNEPFDYAAEMQCSDTEMSIARSPTSEQARQARESCGSINDVESEFPSLELDAFLIPNTTSPPEASEETGEDDNDGHLAADGRWNVEKRKVEKVVINKGSVPLERGEASEECIKREAEGGEAEEQASEECIKTEAGAGGGEEGGIIKSSPLAPASLKGDVQMCDDEERDHRKEDYEANLMAVTGLAPKGGSSSGEKGEDKNDVCVNEGVEKSDDQSRVDNTVAHGDTTKVATFSESQPCVPTKEKKEAQKTGTEDEEAEDEREEWENANENANDVEKEREKNTIDADANEKREEEEEEEEEKKREKKREKRGSEERRKTGGGSAQGAQLPASIQEASIKAASTEAKDQELGGEDLDNGGESRVEETIAQVATPQVRKLPSRVKISFKEIVDKGDEEVTVHAPRSPRMTAWEARQKRIENRMRREKMLDEMAKKQSEVSGGEESDASSKSRPVVAAPPSAQPTDSTQDNNNVTSVRGSGNEDAKEMAQSMQKVAQGRGPRNEMGKLSSEQVVIDLSRCQTITEKPKPAGWEPTSEKASKKKEEKGKSSCVDKKGGLNLAEQEHEEETLEAASRRCRGDDVPASDSAYPPDEDKEAEAMLADLTRGTMGPGNTSNTSSISVAIGASEGKTMQGKTTRIIGEEHTLRRGRHYKIKVYPPEENGNDDGREYGHGHGPPSVELTCVDQEDTDGESDSAVNESEKKDVNIGASSQKKDTVDLYESEKPEVLNGSSTEQNQNDADEEGNAVDEAEQCTILRAPPTEGDKDENVEVVTEDIRAEKKEGLLINTIKYIEEKNHYDAVVSGEGMNTAMPAERVEDDSAVVSSLSGEKCEGPRVEERVDTLEDEVDVIRKKIMYIEMAAVCAPKAVKHDMVSTGCQTDHSLLDAYIARLVLRTDVEDMSTQTDIRVDRRKSSCKSVSFSLAGESPRFDACSEGSVGADGRRLSLDTEEEEELSSEAKQIENVDEYNAEIDLYQSHLAECEDWVKTVHIFATTVRHLGPEGGIEQANLFGARAKKNTMLRNSGTMDEWRWWATTYLSTWSTKTDASSDSHRESMPESRLLETEEEKEGENEGDNEDPDNKEKPRKTEKMEKLDLKSLTQNAGEDHEESDWVTVWSPEYGRCYYWNPVSDEVTWVQPVEDN